jgi:hypothetical protein
MRVRVWINGADGPSRDFELLTTPHLGERITINCGGQIDEGIVASVNWHLQAMDTASGDLLLEGEPAGSVSLVHVICRPASQDLSRIFASAEVGEEAAAH